MIEGIEWLFIGLIVILLVFYDPKKIPQIARAIAQAKQEYEKAASSLVEEVTSIEEEPEESAKEEPAKERPEPAIPYEHEPESPDVHMIKWARMYKIKTYGKTRDEIRRELFEKAREYFFGSKLDLEKGEEAESESLQQKPPEPAEAEKGGAEDAEKEGKTE